VIVHGAVSTNGYRYLLRYTQYIRAVCIHCTGYVYKYVSCTSAVLTALSALLNFQNVTFLRIVGLPFNSNKNINFIGCDKIKDHSSRLCIFTCTENMRTLCNVTYILPVVLSVYIAQRLY